jgi:hypothetical protein
MQAASYLGSGFFTLQVPEVNDKAMFKLIS